MKHFVSSLVLGFSLVSALCAGENILSKSWNIHGGKPSAQLVRTNQNGVMTFKNAVVAGNGYRQWISFSKQPTALKASCEVKAQNVKGDGYGDFAIYMDVLLANGKYAYGQIINFKRGSYDWTKQSQVFKFKQPVKGLNFYVMFRNVSGEAQVRNVKLEVVK